MTRKSVGYFEGTDPELLSNLILHGYDTVPVSNGSDKHGIGITRLNSQTQHDLIIGYLHKITAQPDDDIQTSDMFHVCRTYSIPLLVEVPAALHEQARALIPDAPNVVEVMDPADTLERALEILA